MINGNIPWDAWEARRNDLILIAGPCSGESEQQLAECANIVAKQGVKIFRCGIWKPRTKAGGFEGLGVNGLPLLKAVCAKYKLIPAVEVATPEHIKACVAHDIPLVWLGARTVTNPFSVQNLAECLASTDLSVLVKNPVIPDLDLWCGAIDRLLRAGVTKIGAIHRGFSVYGGSAFRNSPCWNLPLFFKEKYGNIPMICDPSHISGKSILVAHVAQMAIGMKFDGLMVEVHSNPLQALTDAEQQLSEAQFIELLIKTDNDNKNEVDKKNAEHLLASLRSKINIIDEQLVSAIAQRMHIVREIAQIKQNAGISYYQPTRWRAVTESVAKLAEKYEVSESFAQVLFQYIHEESLNEQLRVTSGINSQIDLS